MRPIELSITAFGSFAAEQTLDFTLLDQNNIFLITGPTGAGKTTIFDAISFALYGKASGSGRQSENLRSDFADDSAICTVRFTFELAGERYTIVRSPKQMVRKRGGNLGEYTHKAELTLPDGAVVAGVDPVGKKIAEIVGLDSEQFRRIVMLAQGEFRKLLEAKSNEKQEIFSKLFGTSSYARLTGRLEEKEKQLYSAIQENLNLISHCVNALIRLGHTALSEFSSAQFAALEEITIRTAQKQDGDRDTFVHLKEQLTRLEEERARLQPEQAKQLNAKLARYRAVSEQLAGLNRQEKQITDDIQTVANILEAQKLKIAEDMIWNLKSSTESQTKELEQKTAQLADTSRTFEQVREKQQKIPALEARCVALTEQRTLAAGQFEVLSRLDAVRCEWTQGEKSLKELDEKRIFLSLLADRAKQITEKQKNDAVIALLQTLLENTQNFHQIEAQAHAAKESYLASYRLFLDGQASLLANVLCEGTPCPVCGSTEHPAPAVHAGEIPSEAVLNQQKEAYDILYGTLERHHTMIQSLRQQLALHEIVFSGSTHPIASAQAVQTVLTKHIAYRTDYTQQINALEQQAAVHAKTTDWRKSQYSDPLWLTDAQQDTAAAYSRQESVCRLAKEEIERLSATLHPQFSTVQTLKQHLDSLEREQRTLELTIRQDREQYAEVSSLVQTLTTSIETIQKHLAALRKDFAQKRETFQQEILCRGFSGYKAYRIFVQLIPELNRRQSDIQNHRNRILTLQTEVQTLEPEVQGKEMTDVDGMIEKIAKTGQQLALLNEQKNQLSVSLIGTEQRLNELKFIYADNDELYRTHAIVSELSRLASGKSDQKIAFERYILAVYFDEILAMANLHMAKMTDARFVIRRKQEGSRQSAAGLDLVIFDSHHGTERHVSTLSGGESFQASLALAIGLADTVQMYAGGVSLQTMFIDEGFGTLDEQAADMAVGSLLSLQQHGRLIGIISHVSGLKEQIQAKLIVSKGNRGSSAHFEV